MPAPVPDRRRPQVPRHRRAARAPLVVLTVLVGAAALLAGCTGGAEPDAGSAPPATPTPSRPALADATAEEILDAARQAAGAARTVRLQGRLRQQGSALALDLRIKGEEGATGAVTVGGQQVAVRRVGDAVYLRGEESFYRRVGGAAAVRLLAGKWLRADSADPSFAEFGRFTSLDTVTDQLLTPGGEVTKGPTGEVTGTPAVALTSGAPDGGLLWVALDGEPYPLRIEPGATSAGEGQLDLTEWNQPVDLVAPPDADVVDLSDLSDLAGRLPGRLPGRR